MSISSWTGAPVRSANRANVTSLSAEKRSKTGSSRKSSEICPLAHRGAEAIRRDAGRREALDQLDPTYVARREATLGVGHDDPQVDQPCEVHRG